MAVNKKAMAAMQRKGSSKKATQVAGSSAIREITNNPAFMNYVKEKKLNLDNMSLEDMLKLFNNYAKSVGAQMAVNEAGNYTNPTMRKRMFAAIKRGTKGGRAGQWSARKAQLQALRYKKAGGGYTTKKA